MTAAFQVYDKQAVLAATDLVAMIADDIDLKKSGEYNHIGFCPFHSEDTPSFTVNSKGQFYHCYGCGAHGDAIEWLRQYHGLGYYQAIEELAGRAGIQGEDAPELLSAKSKVKKTTVEFEAALNFELNILQQVVSGRVNYRAMDAQWKQQHQFVSKPPDEHWEREIIAAQRIAKALYALYGVKA